VLLPFPMGFRRRRQRVGVILPEIRTEIGKNEFDETFAGSGSRYNGPAGKLLNGDSRFFEVAADIKFVHKRVLLTERR